MEKHVWDQKDTQGLIDGIKGICIMVLAIFAVSPLLDKFKDK
mgnify:CR=1 FL=1